MITEKLKKWHHENHVELSWFFIGAMLSIGIMMLLSGNLIGLLDIAISFAFYITRDPEIHN